MKRILIISGLFISNLVVAAPNPPPPIPPPPGLPVNQWLLALGLASIVLAFYKIKNIKKASN